MTTKARNKARNIVYLLGAILALALAIGAPHGAVGQDGYPQRAIRIILPFTPGGTADIVARIAAEHLTADLGWRAYIENITGTARPLDGSAEVSAHRNSPEMILLRRCLRDAFTHCCRL